MTMTAPFSVPRVLCISGHDPTGGAGIHADIEAAASQGAHALTVVTALTVQNTRDVRRVSAVAPALIAEQIEALIEDGPIAVIKIGLLGDAAQVRVIVDAIRRLRVPVVFDPVLRAGGGAELVGSGLLAEVIAELLPEVTLLTPNASEARRLAPGSASLDDCALRLLALGCANVLITGGDESGEEPVQNTWYAHTTAPRPYYWPRLPETFHGAGCTLASAIAARLARGESMGAAIDNAQHWTQEALSKAIAVGEGRRIPLRRQT